MTVEDLLPFAYILSGALVAVGAQWCADANRRRLERARWARRKPPTVQVPRAMHEDAAAARWHYPPDVGQRLAPNAPTPPKMAAPRPPQ